MIFTRKTRDKFYDEWFTPPEIVQSLGKFDLDPCASPLCPNKLATRVYGPKEDGLKMPWRGRVWCNPPFGNVRLFVLKMIEHGHGTLLFFAGSETRWQMSALRAAGWVFLFDKNPLFGRPKADMPGKIHQRVWMMPFGDEDADALAKSGLPGVLLKVI
jgi:hypothetical protein